LKVILNHSVQIADTTHLTFDFTNAPAPESAYFSFANLAAGETPASTAELLSLNLNSLSLPTHLVSQQLQATILPSGLLDPADEYIFILSASNSVNTFTRDFIQTTKSPVGQIVTLPPLLTAANVTAAAESPIQVKAEWIGGIIPAGAIVILNQTDATWFIAATPGYVAGQQLVTAPALTGVTGFDPSWALQPGISTPWQLLTNGGGDEIFRHLLPVPIKGMPDNATLSAAAASGTITL
jgi:hypothetical protein